MCTSTMDKIASQKIHLIFLILYYILMFFSAYLHSSPRVAFSIWILDQSNNSFDYFGNENIHGKHKQACLVLYSMEYTTIYDSIYRPNCYPEYYYYFFHCDAIWKKGLKAYIGLCWSLKSVYKWRSQRPACVELTI